MTIFLLSLLIFFTILTYRNLETGVLLICALLPSYLIRFSVFGLPTTFLEMMVLIVVVVCGIKKSYGVMELWSEGEGSFFNFLKNKKLVTSITSRLHDSITPRLFFPLYLLLLAATIGIFVSPDKIAAFGIWKAYFIEPMLIFFVIVDMIGTHKGHPYKRITEKIFLALGVSALFVSLFGIVQWIFQIGIPIPWDIERRITSVFPYPNAVALFLESIVVLSWIKLRYPPLDKGRYGGVWNGWFWLSTCLFSIIAIILAESEAAIAALAITALVFLWMVGKRKIVLTLLATFGLFWFLFLSTLHSPLTTSFRNKLTFQDYSERVRLSQWRETIDLLRDRPIFGAGLSGYPIVMRQYHKDTQYEIFQYPHNILLNVWVELGVLGVVAFGWLMVGIFNRGVMPGLKAWSGLQAGELWSYGVKVLPFFCKNKKTTSETSSLHRSPLITHHSPLFLFLPFLPILLHGLVDVPYFKNDLAMMFWILMACVVAMNGKIASPAKAGSQ